MTINCRKKTMDQDYVKKLENVIRQMLTPLKDVPLKCVIQALSGCDIIPFDSSNKQDKVVLKKLTQVAKLAGAKINSNGILRSRPNEVGNDIEPCVKDALNEVGYQSNIPITSKGKKKQAGYPDIEFIDEFGNYHYLECKTYNIRNVATTQRSFYLSPSDDFKITHAAHHFCLSYEIFESGRAGNDNIYKCRHWKILSLDKLCVDVKHEFNSDNARLYQKELLLEEGSVD